MSKGLAIIVGVGPGLGRSLARVFAEAGHPVALLARDASKLETYAAELSEMGSPARAYRADVTDPATLDAAIASATEELGAPELLIYNAGVVKMDRPTEGDAQDWAYTLAVNVIGAKVAADAVLPKLRGGRGSLLFTGGGLAHEPLPNFGTLSAGKAALRSYVNTLHADLQDTDIHVTSVAIFGVIGGPEPRFNPDTLAQDYLELHRQPKECWTAELLRR